MPANLSSTRHGFDIPANIQSGFSDPSDRDPECDTSCDRLARMQKGVIEKT
jgi:hypothetical protein